MSGVLKGPCYIYSHVRSSHTSEEVMWHLEKYWPVCPHGTVGTQVSWQSPSTIIRGNLLMLGQYLCLPVNACTVPKGRSLRGGIKLTLSLMQLFTIYFCCHINVVTNQIKVANERNYTTTPKYAVQFLFQPGNPGELYPSFRAAGLHYVVWMTEWQQCPQPLPPVAQVPLWLWLAGSLQVSPAKSALGKLIATLGTLHTLPCNVPQSTL